MTCLESASVYLDSLLPAAWTGPDDPVTASEIAASLAIRDIRPRQTFRDDVWADARAHAWELLRRGKIATWPHLCVAARNRALASARALTHWRPVSEVRRANFGENGEAVAVLPFDPDDVIRTVGAFGDVSTRSKEAPSANLRLLHDVLDRIVAELSGRGLTADRARQLVDIVVEHPEVRRGAGRARRRLVREGLAEVSAAALVALILGYPTRGVPGLVERELRGLTGWKHPCVPRLLDLTVHPRGTRLRGMWQDPMHLATATAV